MAEQESNNFVYESSRYKNLMEEYSKLSTDQDYRNWGIKAQTVAAYMHDAISKVTDVIAWEKNRLEQERDNNQQRNIKMSLMQYESFNQILLSQFDKLIQVMDKLPTGSLKPIIPEADKSKMPTPDSPYLKVFVSQIGVILLNGKVTDIEVLKNSLITLAQQNGVVLYAREASESEPPTIVQTVINLVMENRLPIRLCRNDDFSDALDSNGKLRITD